MKWKLSIVIWGISVILAGVGVFYIPWFIPPSQPVPGESFVFGFNNKIGVLTLGVALFLASIAVYINPGKTGIVWIKGEAKLLPSFREGKSCYVVLLSCCILWGGAITYWGNYLNDPSWGESRMFYHGMDLIALGQVPYRDFMFNYGPAMLYLPYGLSYCTGGYFGFEESYQIMLVLFTSAGFLGIFLILQKLELSSSQRLLALILLVGAWASLMMGLQGTPLRFIIIPMAVVLMDNCYEKIGSFGIRSKIIKMIVSATSVITCVSLSPEMGIAGALSVSTYATTHLMRRAWIDGISILSGVIIAISAVLVGFPGYLTSVFAFGSGGDNFPIYPNAHNISLVVISLLTIPILIGKAIADPYDRRAPLSASLGVASVLLLVAAFGRCDPGHVMFNGFLPVIMMFPAAASIKRAWYRMWVGVYIVIYIVLFQVFYWTLYGGLIRSAISTHNFYRENSALVSTWQNDWNAKLKSNSKWKNLHWRKVLPFPNELSQFTYQGPVKIASSDDSNLWLGRYLLLQDRLPPDYFHAFSQGAATPDQIQQKLKESRAYEFLIIPKSAFAPIVAPIDLKAYRQGICSFLSRILLYPVDSEIIHEPYFKDTEYVKEILPDYEPQANFQEYLILKKKSQEASPAAR